MTTAPLDPDGPKTVSDVILHNGDFHGVVSVRGSREATLHPLCGLPNGDDGKSALPTVAEGQSIIVIGPGGKKEISGRLIISDAHASNTNCLIGAEPHAAQVSLPSKKPE